MTLDLINVHCVRTEFFLLPVFVCSCHHFTQILWVSKFNETQATNCTCVHAHSGADCNVHVHCLLTGETQHWPNRQRIKNG